MATLFTKIINGEIPGTFVWQDELCVVLMTINPLAQGHVLVIPRQEVDHWVDAPAPLAAHLFEIARVIGIAQIQAFGCQRVGLIIAGYEISHMHIHVIPTSSMHQLSFANAAARVDPQELAHAALSLKKALGEIGYGWGD